MSLVTNEDERLLTQSVRALLARTAPVSAFRALRDSRAPERFDPGLWRQLVEGGFAAPQVQEAEGGLGMGYAAAGLVAQELGRTLAATPFLSTALSIELLLAAGDAMQQARLLPALLDGSRLAALALEESGRHAPDVIALRAIRDGEGWILDGAKRFVLDGGVADVFFVVATSDAGPLIAVVDAKAPGVVITPLDLIDSRNAADIEFERTPVSADAVLASGDTTAALDRALDVGRALLASELLGLAEEAFEQTVAYLKTRQQFGVLIGSFQALQHRAARLHVALELARGAVLKALRALDSGDPSASLLASLAKGFLTKTARDVMGEAVQMHGGVGVTDDLDIGLFLKRARVAGETFGDDYFQKERLAKLAWRI
jgi:alkylation response protein AidB-like acyl-CoA dehydrogenase